MINFCVALYFSIPNTNNISLLSMPIQINTLPGNFYMSLINGEHNNDAKEKFIWKIGASFHIPVRLMKEIICDIWIWYTSVSL